MTAGVVWGLAGIGAVVLGLYVFAADLHQQPGPVAAVTRQAPQRPHRQRRTVRPAQPGKRLRVVGGRLAGARGRSRARHPVGLARRGSHQRDRPLTGVPDCRPARGARPASGYAPA